MHSEMSTWAVRGISVALSPYGCMKVANATTLGSATGMGVDGARAAASALAHTPLLRDINFAGTHVNPTPCFQCM